MKYFGNEASEKHKTLQQIIRKKDRIDDSKRLFLEIHALLNRSVVSDSLPNEVDTLFSDLTREEYAIMPTHKDETIAWCIWHIARIEDITMGFLVAEKEQLFNEEWKRKIKVPIIDTGNALNDDEILKLSNVVDINELMKYRDAVAQRTRRIISELTFDDMRRKIVSESIEKIRIAGGVTSQKDSIWLLDYWGKKDVAGLLLMPPTRHVILHLNDCCKWKKIIRNNEHG